MTKIRLAAAAVAAAAVSAWAIRRPALTPEMRGARLAGRMGCYACHGPGGTGGVPNAGSEEGEVPSWTGGTLMMYTSSPDEVREWIADGVTRQRAGRSGGYHPAGLLHMPAFRGRLDGRDLDGLTAYVWAVGRWKPPDDARVAAGFKAAGRLGCFGCHGPGGRTGSPNPGSFKRVIPPWYGADFRDLVRTDDELRGWINDGTIPRLDHNPVARWFLGRQTIRMPAFRTVLARGDLESLAAYIRSLTPRSR